jgi:hypothetical protein
LRYTFCFFRIISGVKNLRSVVNADDKCKITNIKNVILIRQFYNDFFLYMCIYFLYNFYTCVFISIIIFIHVYLFPLYFFYTCVFISIIFFFMHVYLFLLYIYGILIVVNLPPTLAKSQVSSVRKNLKMHMLSLLRHPASQDHITQITTLLTDLGATNSEVRPYKRYISLVLWLDNNQQIRCTVVVLLLCYPHRVAS